MNDDICTSVETHCRKSTGRILLPRRFRPRSSRSFVTSWTSATSPRSSPRWTPPTPPQPCPRTATASFRWEAFEVSDTCLGTGRRRQFEIFLPYGGCCFLPMFAWAVVAGSVFALDIIPSVPATIFDTLHGNPSNQVKL